MELIAVEGEKEDALEAATDEYNNGYSYPEMKLTLIVGADLPIYTVKSPHGDCIKSYISPAKDKEEE